MLYQELSDSGKKYVRVMLFALLAVLFIFGAILSAYYYASWKQVRHATKNFQVSVSGEGKISAKPDVATFTFGVRTENAKLKSAQDENSTRSQKVVQFLKSSGVADKDIRTTFYNINPQYQYPKPCSLVAPYPCVPTVQSKPVIVGYEAVSSYEVKIRDIGKAGDILDGVTSAGATEVNGPSFAVDNSNSAKTEARKIAIDNAKEKAAVLAHDLGVRLGEIVGFSESGNGYPIMFEKALSANGGGVAASAPSIEPGQNEITSNVTITYEIR